MTCATCQRNMVNCICEDADEKIESLLECKFLDRGWIERIQAQRLLNKFDIQRDKKKAAK